MLIYLDMCCLKRPFDDQSQPRIRLESEAVLSLLAAESDGVRFVRSMALVLENSRNPVFWRAARVARWLSGGDLAEAPEAGLEQRAEQLMALGCRNFDSLHLASAEAAGAQALATCDDQFLATAARHQGKIRTRVVGVIELAQEVLR